MEVSSRLIALAAVVAVVAAATPFVWKGWQHSPGSVGTDTEMVGGRLHLLDNARALSMFCMIYGHSMEAGPWLSDSGAEAALVSSLLPCPAPMFVFVSGICSQGRADARRVRAFLLGLVVPAALWTFPLGQILHGTISPNPVSPLAQWRDGGLRKLIRLDWYLPALVLWRGASLLFFGRLPTLALLLGATVVSCAAGYFDLSGNLLFRLTAANCVLGYLPYFVAGYVFPLQKACQKLPALHWPAWLFAAGALLLYDYLHWNFLPAAADPRHPYKAAFGTGALDWVWRFVEWAVDMVGVFLALLAVFPRSQAGLSWMGSQTLYPYLLVPCFTSWQGVLADALPLPAAGSGGLHPAAGLLLQAAIALLAQALLSCRFIRLFLSPVLSPAWLGPLLDRAMGGWAPGDGMSEKARMIELATED